MLEVSYKVSQNMKDNPNFAKPAIPMSEFDKDLMSLQTCYNNRRSGKLAKLNLQNACVTMDTTLRTQGLYITETAKGDNVIIETSGFTPSKGDSTKAVVPEMPTDVKLQSKNSNVCLMARKPKGAASLCWIVYYGEMTGVVTVEHNILSVPRGVEAQIISPAMARQAIMGLTPGTKVNAQVLAQNAAGCSALSELVSIYINK